MTAPTKPQADFERMAAELESIAKHTRERPTFNNHFAERIELLARQMREEATRPAPPREVDQK